MMAGSPFEVKNLAFFLLCTYLISNFFPDLCRCLFDLLGIVYDITDYIPRHPGGIAVLIPCLGKDATEAFVHVS